VDGFGQSHNIPHPCICNGSVFPTQGSPNQELIIMALAARTADDLIAERDLVLNKRRGSGATPCHPARSASLGRA
jgi:choline dehydrogenase-like flavoprotein